MYATTFFWAAYLGVALFLGGVSAAVIVMALRRLGHVPEHDDHRISKCDLFWFSQIFFVTERTAFFLISFHAGGSMSTQLAFAWMGLKMAANWNRYPGKSGDSENKDINERARGALSALIGSVVAIGFAIAGGMIARGFRPF